MAATAVVESALHITKWSQIAVPILVKSNEHTFLAFLSNIASTIVDISFSTLTASFPGPFLLLIEELVVTFPIFKLSYYFCKSKDTANFQPISTMKRNLTINWSDTTDSTNSEAMRNLHNVEGNSVWSADFQTAGRGQRGNKWHSTRALNLTFSILLKDVPLAPHLQHYISMISALAVADYIKSKGIDARIKWPNDIYVGDRKICGMLIENILGSDTLSASIIGIGINLNQTEFDSALSNPTSLLKEVQDRLPDRSCFNEFDRHKELEAFIDCFFDLYSLLNIDGGKEMFRRRFESLLYRRDEWHSYEEISESSNLNRPVETIAGNRITARILGIDDQYNLVLEHKDGHVRQYAFKEIKYIL